jgi:hypothetical protein
MANPFYTPSGNPATGAQGLSLLMRTEFAAISAAFDMMPSFETTGLYTTTFNQQGTFTFTLPAQPGTLALTSDVAAETARATAAEVVNAAAIATKQGALGYNPVQQGTGVGQLGNVVKIGWSPGGLAYTIDVTNEGYFVTTSNPQGFALSADVATAVATEQARAIAAEGVNTAAIATEAAARTAETVRATAAEAVNALTAAHNVGRNKLHNGLFRVQQRGPGPFAISGVYTADRWLQGMTNSTMSTSFVALTDADRTAIGDEEAELAMQCVVGGTAGANDVAVVLQRIEALHRLSGKTVIASFWARATSGTPAIGYAMSQYFSSGGSPSPTIDGIGAGKTAPLSTAWTRYTATITLPSAAGKTFGNNSPTADFTQLSLYFSSGSTESASAGGIGVQSGTIQLWGLQLEIGTAATPLEKPDLALERANCQRFYQLIFASARAPATAEGQLFDSTISFPTMRATPTTLLVSVGTNNNLNSIQIYTSAPNWARFEMTANGSGDAYALTYGYSLSADL